MPYIITGPAIVNILAPTPSIYPSFLNSIAGETTALAKLIRDNTGVKYSRTITCSDNFDLQDNLYRFNPTVYHLDFDKIIRMGTDFINMTPDKPQIFYIWGHTYEFDYASDYRVKFEEFLKLISNRDDIFYGTNKEVLL